jgi:osmotically-inducible protein OsmY
MFMFVIIAGMLFIGCEKEKKRITAEPVQPTDQRRTIPSTSASPQPPKKPPVSSAQERRDQKEAAGDNRDNRIESKKDQVKPDSPTSKTLAEQKHAEQMAAVPSNKREGEANKQAESVTPLDQSESEANVAVTQRIRQALLREDLSFAAKNVLVITEADHVVLKGHVRSASEAERIKGIAGTMTTKRIEDVLEVRP